MSCRPPHLVAGMAPSTPSSAHPCCHVFSLFSLLLQLLPHCQKQTHAPSLVIPNLLLDSPRLRSWFTLSPLYATPADLLRPPHSYPGFCLAVAGIALLLCYSIFSTAPMHRAHLVTAPSLAIFHIVHCSLSGVPQPVDAPTPCWRHFAMPALQVCHTVPAGLFLPSRKCVPWAAHPSQSVPPA